MSGHDDFFAHVEREFVFLIDQFGFRLTQHKRVGDSLCVEYRSEHVYVRVLKSAPDFEPRFVLGRIGVDDLSGASSFDWVDVAGMNCCCDWHWQQIDEEPYKGRVRQLAKLLKKCGRDALRGRGSAFLEMLNKRDQLRNKHLAEEKEQLIRSQAATAWEKKEYEKVAREYNEIRNRLTETERKRMCYAQKQI